nr:unnamed protein product [Digitaria exilis]
MGNAPGRRTWCCVEAVAEVNVGVEGADRGEHIEERGCGGALLEWAKAMSMWPAAEASVARRCWSRFRSRCRPAPAHASSPTPLCLSSPAAWSEGDSRAHGLELSVEMDEDVDLSSG